MALHPKDKSLLLFMTIMMSVGALGGYAVEGDLRGAAGGAVFGFVAFFFLAGD